MKINLFQHMLKSMMAHLAVLMFLAMPFLASTEAEAESTRKQQAKALQKKITRKIASLKKSGPIKLSFPKTEAYRKAVAAHHRQVEEAAARHKAIVEHHRQQEAAAQHKAAAEHQAAAEAHRKAEEAAAQHKAAAEHQAAAEAHRKAEEAAAHQHPVAAEEHQHHVPVVEGHTATGAPPPPPPPPPPPAGLSSKKIEKNPPTPKVKPTQADAFRQSLEERRKAIVGEEEKKKEKVETRIHGVPPSPPPPPVGLKKGDTTSPPVGGSESRSALHEQIHQGIKLKKVEKPSEAESAQKQGASEPGMTKSLREAMEKHRKPLTPAEEAAEKKRREEEDKEWE
jgi:hypothetical protein